MKKANPGGPFGPKLSALEQKVDATTRTVREIAHEEATARKAKTDRLRAARLAREAESGAATPTDGSET